MIDLVRSPADLRRATHILDRWSDPRPPAVILGASPNGLSFVRSIGRRGIPVLVLEGPKPMPGLHSCYGTGLLLPDPVDREAFWLETLDALGKAASSKPVLVPTGDAHVLLVSRNRGLLENRYRFLLPAEEILEKLPNKKEQYRLAEAHAVPIPKTFYPTTDQETERAGLEAGFPCIVKPYVAHLWKRIKEKKLEETPDLPSLLRAVRAAREIGQEVLVQERIPGGDDALYGLLAYYDREGRPLCLLTKRKLRQYPVGQGDGSYQVVVRVPEVRDLGDRFFRGMGYRGLGTIEFKKDPRSGVFKLIEVNPRSVSGQAMSTAAGMDIPYMAYADIGEVARQEPTESFREPVYFVNERWDVQSFLQNRRMGNLTFAGWVRSFLGKKVACAFFAWDDPGPAARMWGTVLRNALRRKS
jgi:predicted ATP-grasp superfamily ATP-dependent carboligase